MPLPCCCLLKKHWEKTFTEVVFSFVFIAKHKASWSYKLDKKKPLYYKHEQTNQVLPGESLPQYMCMLWKEMLSLCYVYLHAACIISLADSFVIGWSME